MRFCSCTARKGWYLERTVNYLHRVGMAHVKKHILEDHDRRKALWDRLQFSLAGEPDPWFAQKDAAVDARQFTALEASAVLEHLGVPA